VRRKVQVLRGLPVRVRTVGEQGHFRGHGKPPYWLTSRGWGALPGVKGPGNIGVESASMLVLYVAGILILALAM